MTSLLRRVGAAGALLLLLVAHSAAGSLAADCAARCHSCCLMARGPGGSQATPGAHCALMGEPQRAASCGLRAHCHHAAEAAITGLPLATFTTVPALRDPSAVPSVNVAPQLAVAGWATRLDIPPPRRHLTT